MQTIILENKANEYQKRRCERQWKGKRESENVNKSVCKYVNNFGQRKISISFKRKRAVSFAFCATNHQLYRSVVFRRLLVCVCVSVYVCVCVQVLVEIDNNNGQPTTDNETRNWKLGTTAAATETETEAAAPRIIHPSVRPSIQPSLNPSVRLSI